MLILNVLNDFTQPIQCSKSLAWHKYPSEVAPVYYSSITPCYSTPKFVLPSKSSVTWIFLLFLEYKPLYWSHITFQLKLNSQLKYPPFKKILQVEKMDISAQGKREFTLLLPIHTGEGGSSLHSLLIEMLISSRDTVKDTPRKNVLPAIWASLMEVKLNHRLNQHS